MDLVSVFAPVLGLSIFIERIMETIWNTVEYLLERFAPVPRNPFKKLKGTATAGSTNAADYDWTTGYVQLKQIASVIIALVMGVFLANNFGFGFLTLIPNMPVTLTAIANGKTLGMLTDTFLAGIIAGMVAPYSHQVVESLLNFQKFLEAQKNNISNG